MDDSVPFSSAGLWWAGRLPKRWEIFATAMAAIVFAQAFSILCCEAWGKTASPGAALCRINVVAAENFYQNIAGQIGGPCVRVQSVLSDPNIDPHEYEPTIRDAEEVAEANLIIENGGGYDEWMNKLAAASPKSGRIVITVWSISPVKLPDNEHVWYSVEDMKAVAGAMADALKKLCPSQAARFDKNLKTFNQSMDAIGARIGELAKRFSGTVIALTEPIFMYQAIPMGLKVSTPLEFQRAVAQGIEPPSYAMLAAQNQIREKKVRVLVYNRQTADRFTARLEELARASGIAVVAVTETMPRGKTYQSWMLGQIEAIGLALGSPKALAGKATR
ncbi:MAG: metal ABC transporter solute-binding protein, Zn/Mn family [Syntrophobacteraceae bacterium]